jgi:hypothetical protein
MSFVNGSTTCPFSSRNTVAYIFIVRSFVVNPLCRLYSSTTNPRDSGFWAVKKIGAQPMRSLGLKVSA